MTNQQKLSKVITISAIALCGIPLQNYAVSYLSVGKQQAEIAIAHERLNAGIVPLCPSAGVREGDRLPLVGDGTYVLGADGTTGVVQAGVITEIKGDPALRQRWQELFKQMGGRCQ